MEEFAEDKQMNIFIASLKAGGTGLNLSMAYKCIMVDLWWNEAIQDQVSSQSLVACTSEPQQLLLLVPVFLIPWIH